MYKNAKRQTREIFTRREKLLVNSRFSFVRPRSSSGESSRSVSHKTNRARVSRICQLLYLFAFIGPSETEQPVNFIKLTDAWFPPRFNFNPSPSFIASLNLYIPRWPHRRKATIQRRFHATKQPPNEIGLHTEPNIGFRLKSEPRRSFRPRSFPRIKLRFLYILVSCFPLTPRFGFSECFDLSDTRLGWSTITCFDGDTRNGIDSLLSLLSVGFTAAIGHNGVQHFLTTDASVVSNCIGFARVLTVTRFGIDEDEYFRGFTPCIYYARCFVGNRVKSRVILIYVNEIFVKYEDIFIETGRMSVVKFIVFVVNYPSISF